MIFNKKIIIIFSALLFNIFVNVKSAPPSKYKADVPENEFVLAENIETDEPIIRNELKRNMDEIQIDYNTSISFENNLEWIRHYEKDAKVVDISNLSQEIFELSLISNSVVVTDGYAPIHIVSKDNDGVMANFANKYCTNTEIKISYGELFSFVQSHKSKLVYKLPFSDIHKLGFFFDADRSIYPMFEVNCKTSKQKNLLSKLLASNNSSGNKFSVFSFGDTKLYNVQHTDGKYYLSDVVNNKSVDITSIDQLFPNIFNFNESVYVSFSPLTYSLYDKLMYGYDMSEEKRIADKKLCDELESSNVYGTIEGKDLKSEDDFNKIPLVGAKVFIDGIPSFNILRRNQGNSLFHTDSELQSVSKLKYEELFQLMKVRQSKILYINNLHEGLNFKCRNRECLNKISNRALDDFINLYYPECNMARDVFNIDEFIKFYGKDGNIPSNNIKFFADTILQLIHAGPIMIYLPMYPLDQNNYLNYTIQKITSGGEDLIRVTLLHTVPDKQGSSNISYDVPLTQVYKFSEYILSHLEYPDDLYIGYFSHENVKTEVYYKERCGGISCDLGEDRLDHHGGGFWRDFVDDGYNVDKFKSNRGFNSFFIMDKQYFEKARNFEKSKFVQQEGCGGCWFSAFLGLLNIKNIKLDFETLKTHLKKDNMSELFASNLSYFINNIRGLSPFDDSACSSSEEFINIINQHLLSRINKKMFYFGEVNPKNPEQTIFNWWQKYHNIVINSMDDHVVLLVDMPDINTMIVEEWGIRYTINTKDFWERTKSTYEYEGYKDWYLRITWIE